MTLHERLKKAKSEEDVKDAYIKALDLKGYSKNLVDIQTKEIWFEAKYNAKLSSYVMFTQLLHYVQDALNKGEQVPALLAVIDERRASIMKSSDVLPFLAKKTVKWGKSASGYTKEAVDTISAHIGTHFVSFKIETDEEEFISTIKSAIQKGDIIRTQITPDNLKQVFDKWVEMIGREIKGIKEDDYALLFYADVMHDGKVSTHDNLTAELMHKNDSPVFGLRGKIYELGNKEGYRKFWAMYHKPPKSEYRNYLLERRDSLIPLDERSFKGAYYTPLKVVDKAYDKLTETLGKDWQKDYIVWDMCCGVGNLEVKHSNQRNIYMSTLDSEDIDVMKATKTCVASQIFQYDYLNDDISDDGTIDYSITNKVPQGLRDAIKKGKKILILINPPYAEASSSDNASSDKDESKKGVSSTQISKTMEDYGYAKRELFTQFVARISKEIPTSILAMFSTLKYVNAPNFEGFRKIWNAEYLGGFVIHSKSFDGLKGNFPIGFLIWKTNQKNENIITEISADVLDKDCKAIGEKKFYNISNDELLGSWLERPKSNKTEVVPLKNSITPATVTKDLRGTKWSDDAIGCMFCQGSDMQHVNQTALLSSGFSSAGSFFVNSKNISQSAVIFSVRRLIKATWLNDRDQFLKPSKPLTNEFKNDCLIWMLFNGSNLTASADDLEWNNKKWSIVNHFIPFSEEEVNANGRFESDFMVEYLKDKKLSKEARLVLEEGKKLWTSYFSQKDVRTVRDELKLNRPDVGWYQIRKAIQSRNLSGDYKPVYFEDFENAYKSLTEKLQPQVYELGFLKN